MIACVSGVYCATGAGVLGMLGFYVDTSFMPDFTLNLLNFSCIVQKREKKTWIKMQNTEQLLNK
jgi:hypothetical protein